MKITKIYDSFTERTIAGIYEYYVRKENAVDYEDFRTAILAGDVRFKYIGIYYIASLVKSKSGVICGHKIVKEEN